MPDRRAIGCRHARSALALVDERLHAPLNQMAVVLARTKQPAAAMSFIEFVNSARGGPSCGNSGSCCPENPSKRWTGFPSGCRFASRCWRRADRLMGVPLAWLLARRHFPGRDLISAALLSPLVLPPTVLGYYLLMLIGSRGASAARSPDGTSSSHSPGAPQCSPPPSVRFRC